MHPLSPLPPLSLSSPSTLPLLFLPYFFFVFQFSIISSENHIKVIRDPHAINEHPLHSPLSSSSLLLLPHFFLVFQSGIIATSMQSSVTPTRSMSTRRGVPVQQ